MKMSPSIANLAAALVSAQAEFTVVVKDANNPFFRSNYATLKAIVEMLRAPLAKHGLSYVQGIDIVEGEKVMATTIIHKSGEWLVSFSPFYTNPSVDKDKDGKIVREYVKPQDGGSGVTYSKRYGLQAAFGVVVADDDTDDDGNRANHNKSNASSMAF